MAQVLLAVQHSSYLTYMYLRKHEFRLLIVTSVVNRVPYIFYHSMQKCGTAKLSLDFRRSIFRSDRRALRSGI